ncbi:AAA family ATPase [Paracoccus hibiscisoli]|uniref:AAA family ATPase n=1 Tax=Paracoccus hibiscisoli TaxID=2023261 RepID=A0A4U0QGM1_9RHOB|nr:AAA family ATPase [Paracoccus hibiscisoli]TJZ80727.1 AAA family ATPase [Paracoccus hibiscisoli]
MTSFPFIKATFPDPDMNPRRMCRRLVLHLLRLRAARAGVDLPECDDETLHDKACQNRVEGVALTREDHRRANSRANRLYHRILRESGLDHLDKTDRDRLSALQDGVHIARISDEHRADDLAAALHAEMPWMAPATEYAWHAMRRSVREGRPGFRLPPVILDGPTGIGKTRWARRLGELVGASSTVVDATGEATSFGVVGCQRGWTSARPGRVLELILMRMTGNPFIIIDELDKAGHVRSDKGHSFGLAEGLLPLLEPATAADWTCPYFRVRFDMSLVSWVLLTNTVSPVPEPLLSRCTILRLKDVDLPHLIGFAEREGRARALSEASIRSIADALAAVAPQAPARPSLRTVLRMLDRAADLENRPMVI